MLRIKELRLPLDHGAEALPVAIAATLGIERRDLLGWSIVRRSYDARRGGAITLIYQVDVQTAPARESRILARLRGDARVGPTPDTSYRFVARSEQAAPAGAGAVPRPIVIGMGPCGLFAALLLAEMGLRPLVLERGKAVRERTVDTFGLWRKRVLDPESNVQFGEGGAGTFSDGKLYSQIRDPGHRGRKVLEELVAAGAPAEILFVSKPHIGTFRLVKVVEAMRAKIESLGGEIRFQCRVEDLLVERGRVRGVVVAGAGAAAGDAGDVGGGGAGGGERLAADHVVLAPGHSARDTFQMLARRGVLMEAKPFSIGFRIEHPQSLIDRRRFGAQAGHPLLGAADYKLVHHCSNGRSAYSFCMCPGGTVVAAASEPGRVVTNGMSQYSRDERNANSGIVVGITPEDYPGGPLAGVELQRFWETRAFELGGSSYDAPAQRVGDFLAGRPSTAPGAVLPSYRPAVRWGDLTSCLPDYAIAAIREALPAFDRQLRGFAMEDAVLTGVETRTSAPVRLTRRDDDLQSVAVAGLYPAGEGAGYAGGILSAAVDGIRVAEAVALSITQAASADRPSPSASAAAGMGHE